MFSRLMDGCGSQRWRQLRVAGLLEGRSEPLKTFVETVTGGSAGGLDEPSPLSETVKTKLVGDLCGVHGIRQILFVGEDKEHGIPELILVQHALQLLTSFNYTIAIVAVDDEDDALSVLEIMSPERSDLVLSTDIPHCELNVLVLDGLDVEADCGNGGDDFAELELIQDRGLSGSVQANHQDAHFLLSP